MQFLLFRQSYLLACNIQRQQQHKKPLFVTPALSMLRKSTKNTKDFRIFTQIMSRLWKQKRMTFSLEKEVSTQVFFFCGSCACLAGLSLVRRFLNKPPPERRQSTFRPVLYLVCMKVLKEKKCASSSPGCRSPESEWFSS